MHACVDILNTWACLAGSSITSCDFPPWFHWDNRLTKVFIPQRMCYCFCCPGSQGLCTRTEIQRLLSLFVTVTVLFPEFHYYSKMNSILIWSNVTSWKEQLEASESPWLTPQGEKPPVLRHGHRGRGWAKAREGPRSRTHGRKHSFHWKEAHPSLSEPKFSVWKPWGIFTGVRLFKMSITVEYYSPRRKEEFLSFGATWAILGGTVQSEIS